jgi:aminopeptidase N
MFTFEKNNCYIHIMKKHLLIALCFIAFSVVGQQTTQLDFKKGEVNLLALSPSNNEITGTVTYYFNVLQPIDTITLEARNFKSAATTVNGKQRPTMLDEATLKIPIKLTPSINNTLTIQYATTPSSAMYFIDTPISSQVWTQGQGKYTSNWLPSFDDMNEKVEFDLTITSPKQYEVVANGVLKSTKQNGDDRTWSFDMEQPMSSYLLAIAVGEFEKKQITSTSGIPVTLYYSPQDAAKFEPTYRYTKEIFDFLESEIGVAYPWQDYKQVPVRDFLYAGMENTTATFFSEAFVVDSIGFNDRNYVNVNAHELAHQWFGNLVTETEGTHHWLHESFATYYALLAEREIFGDDYYYWKLYNSAEQLATLSEEGKGETLLNPNASSLTFYEKGAWALHMLKEKIGEAAFKEAIVNYLQKYKYKNVTTEDFLTEVRAVSLIDITTWEVDWLKQSAFKAEQAYFSLLKSPFMEAFFKISALRALPFEQRYNELEAALINPNDFIGQEAINQLAGQPIPATLPLYKKGLESGNLYVRQAIAISLETIPEALQTQYETLLDDPSYLTQEAALYMLTSQFPAQRKKYLEKMKNVTGFQDKNVRMLWLYIALSTNEYGGENNGIFLNELVGYTNNQYSFEIREAALNYVSQFLPYSEDFLRNVVDASVHHYWRFRDDARDFLNYLLKDETYKLKIEAMMDSFPEKEKAYLKRAGFKTNK